MTAVFVVHLPTNDALPGNLNPVMNGIFVTSPLPGGEIPSYDAAVLPDAAALPSDTATVPSDDGAAIDGATADDDGGASLADGAAESASATDIDAGPSTSIAGWELDDQGSVHILRNQHVSIQPGISIESSELMAQPGTLDDVFDSNGILLGTVQFERLDFAYFAEAGDFGSDGNGGRTPRYQPNIPDSPAAPSVRASADQAQFNSAISNTWTLPLSSDYLPITSRIIVVVRDSRGGVAWTSGVATLQDKP
jgi:hypothetical protein